MKKQMALALLPLLIFIGSCSKPDTDESIGTGEVLKLKETLAAVPQGDPLSKNEVDNIVVGTKASPSAISHTTKAISAMSFTAYRYDKENINPYGMH